MAAQIVGRGRAQKRPRDVVDRAVQGSEHHAPGHQERSGRQPDGAEQDEAGDERDRRPPGAAQAVEGREDRLPGQQARKRRPAEGREPGHHDHHQGRGTHDGLTRYPADRVVRLMARLGVLNLKLSHQGEADDTPCPLRRQAPANIPPVGHRAHRGRDRKGVKRKPGTPPPAGRAPGRLLLLLAAAIVPLLLFWHTTGFGYLLDDTVLFQKSPSLTDPASIPRGFLTDVGALRKSSDTPLGSYYRPVFLALSTLYHQAAGGEPFVWHLAAVALAGAVGALACALFLRLGFPPLLALLAAVVFSLHPAHVSSVAWASGLQELLAAFFLLVAVLALLRRPGPKNDRRAIATATIAFVLALLSKEVAIGLLPLAGVWAFARRATEPEESRRFGKATVVFGVATLLYLGVRVAVLGGLARPWPHAPGLAAAIPSVPLAFVTYLRLLVWPSGFSFFRPERPVWGFLDAPVLVSLLILVVLALFAAWPVRRRRELLLPLAWFVVWLLPVLNFWALGPEWMVSDRYLFLPALALPWLIVLLAPRRVAIGVLAVLALAFAALSLRYAAIFRDERAFVAAMEEAEPTSAIVFTEKARLLRDEGKTAAAE